jgi:hypothetical protein
MIPALLFPVLANSADYPAIYFANRLPVHENSLLKLLTRVSLHFVFLHCAFRWPVPELIQPHLIPYLFGNEPN